jgi:hypothetical protein
LKVWKSPVCPMPFTRAVKKWPNGTATRWNSWEKSEGVGLLSGSLLKDSRIDDRGQRAEDRIENAEVGMGKSENGQVTGGR